MSALNSLNIKSQSISRLMLALPQIWDRCLPHFGKANRCKPIAIPSNIKVTVGVDFGACHYCPSDTTFEHRAVHSLLGLGLVHNQFKGTLCRSRSLKHGILQFHKTVLTSNILARQMATRREINDNEITLEDQQKKILSDPRGNKRMNIKVCYSKNKTEVLSLISDKSSEKYYIEFDLDYYDSQELLESNEVSSANAPVVCLLHGSPGHYKDFAYLIDFLTRKGIRVLAPNFPDYSYTKNHGFFHSPPERVLYLVKFFETLQISSIDMLLGHSSAGYTVFELLNHSLKRSSESAGSHIRIKSVAMLNISTYNLPAKIKPTPGKLFAMTIFELPMPQFIRELLGRIMVKYSPTKMEKVEDLLIAAKVIVHTNQDNMIEYLKLVREYKIPSFVLISGKDRLLPVSCFDQLKRDLGIRDDKQVKYYDVKGQVIKTPSDSSELVEVSDFEGGGHYTFQVYSKEVNEDIYGFLVRKVVNVGSSKL